MKLNRLFFYNFGLISKIARISFVVLLLAYAVLKTMLVYSGNLTEYIFLMIALYAMSFILVTPDWMAIRKLGALREAFEEEIKGKYSYDKEADIRFCDGYQLIGDFNKRRTIKGTFIAPNTSFIAFVESKGKLHVECITYMFVLKEGPVRYEYVFDEGIPANVKDYEYEDETFECIDFDMRDIEEKNLFYIKRNHDLRKALGFIGLSVY